MATISLAGVANSAATVIGVGQKGTHMATKTINFTLAVTTPPDWFLAIAPASLSVAQGTSAVFNVTATAQGGYTGNITLSVLGLPAGVTPTFSVNPIAQNGTSTLTIPTAAIPVGTLALTLQGVGA
jgi:hypothetical protein